MLKITKIERLKTRSGGCLTKLINSQSIVSRDDLEVYCLYMPSGEVKDWRRHRELACNLFLINGKVVVEGMNSHGSISKYPLEVDGDNFVSIPPGTAFRILNLSDEEAIISNVLNGQHSDEEVEFL